MRQLRPGGDALVQPRDLALLGRARRKQGTDPRACTGSPLKRRAEKPACPTTGPIFCDACAASKYNGEGPHGVLRSAAVSTRHAIIISAMTRPSLALSSGEEPRPSTSPSRLKRRHHGASAAALHGCGAGDTPRATRGREPDAVAAAAETRKAADAGDYQPRPSTPSDPAPDLGVLGGFRYRE